MKYLGIDYGKKKVGLALSDGVYASAWKMLNVNSLKDALAKIKQAVKGENIDQVVIGKPESGESRNITLQFIKQLKKELPQLFIVEVEETLSTQRAIDQLVAMDVSKKARKAEDMFAAAMILQDYLDRKNND